MASKSIQCHF